MDYHYTIGYRVATDGRPHVIHTYAATDEQAIADLYDCVPDVLSGRITFKLKAPAGARS
jgi:hypothetical protein